MYNELVLKNSLIENFIISQVAVEISINISSNHDKIDPGLKNQVWKDQQEWNLKIKLLGKYYSLNSDVLEELKSTVIPLIRIGTYTPNNLEEYYEYRDSSTASVTSVKDKPRDLMNLLYDLQCKIENSLVGFNISDIGIFEREMVLKKRLGKNI